MFLYNYQLFFLASLFRPIKQVVLQIYVGLLNAFVHFACYLVKPVQLTHQRIKVRTSIATTTISMKQQSN